MFRNYLIITFRNLIRNKSYTTINVLGLALGITCSLLIFLVITYELNFDGFHSHKDHIYRITNDYKYPDFTMHAGNTAYPVAEVLRNDFPILGPSGEGMVTQVDYRKQGKMAINHSQEKRNYYNEENILFADHNFFKVFDYGKEQDKNAIWLEGNPDVALAEPNTIVLTESIAKKYFGEWKSKGALLGKEISMDDKYNLKVTGVVKDLPSNTHLPYSILVSMATLKASPDSKSNFENWGYVGKASTYVLLPDRPVIRQIKSQFPAFADKYANKVWGKSTVSFDLQPLTEIHFDERFADSSIIPVRKKETIWAIGLIGFLIMVTACINFINLSTAQAIKRAKEVGIRKVLGAVKGQLVSQFLGETFMITLVAVAVATGLAYLLLPYLDQLLESKIAWNVISVSFFLAVLIVLVSLLAGIYPALVLSGFRPVLALKAGLVPTSRGGISLRRTLVVFQFSICQALIIGTVVVASQMQYFRNKDLGYQKDAILVVNIPGKTDKSKLDAIRNELLKSPGIREVSYANAAPTATEHPTTPFRSIDLQVEDGHITEHLAIDEHFLDTYEMKLLAGEDLANKSEANKAQGFIVNEAMVRQLGLQEPRDAIGKRISVGKEAPIIGVVKDFHSRSLHSQINPIILHYHPEDFSVASIKIQAQDMGHTLKVIQDQWTTYFPNELFTYSFMDEKIAELYRAEDKIFQIFQVFSAIAIFIGCLGLYGLVSYMAVQRTKEVGIRKVLGASVVSIVMLFSKEFIQLITLAFLIASPLAWYLMNNWLQDFTYHITIGIGVFSIAIAFSITIALLTVGYKSVKAALANPVKSLRSE